MTKNATTANGEAMPSLNRRRLLMGLAAASTVAAGVVAIQTQPAHGEAFANFANPPENPELAALGAMTADLLAELVAAQTAERQAEAVGNGLWPLAPAAIVKGYQDHHAWERKLSGAALYRDGKDKPLSLLTADEIAHDIDMVSESIRRKRRTDKPIYYRGQTGTIAEWQEYVIDARKRHASAVRYESRKANALKVSGYPAAVERAAEVRERLTVHVDAVMSHPANTMTGVMIKAEALAAFSKLERFWRVTEPRAWGWAGSFAALILQIAGGEA